MTTTRASNYRMSMQTAPLAFADDLSWCRWRSRDLDNPSQSCSVVIGELCARETFGLRPPSAERLEDGRGLTRDLDTALRQSVLRIEPHALGVEHGEKIVDAKLVALPGEIGGRPRGPGRQIEVTEAFPLLHVRGDRALGFLERQQGGALVVRERDFGGGVG